MSISEICQIITSLAFLTTAAVLCLQSRYLYWISKDLSDSCDKIYQEVERLTAGSEPGQANVHTAPNPGICSEADRE